MHRIERAVNVFYILQIGGAGIPRLPSQDEVRTSIDEQSRMLLFQHQVRNSSVLRLSDRCDGQKDKHCGQATSAIQNDISQVTQL